MSVVHPAVMCNAIVSPMIFIKFSDIVELTNQEIQ
jgi:hypothetical protein